ncbi:unnamed protein product [Lactuca saligna]|uniref:Arabidopsis retrotransposon Orf1 C-terminal domain-containing protein n=1 Tax=Lactuca saligna TaxID=75948 RepID=A0AA35UQQ8_LACSI|nr:unnamed protein product [Lactuca saligna]
MSPRPSRPRRQGDAPEPSYTVQADNITVDLGSQATVDCYQRLLDREIMEQAWAPSRSLMREVHIYDGVHALFANIEWEHLLSMDFATCHLLTRDFLSTLSEINHEGNLAFHISSTPHTIHVDQLCTIFHTPITSLFHPTPTFDVHEFRYSITELETTKAGKAKLFLLWCMITKSYRTHFGDIIIQRFHRVISLHTGGAIRCGGLISVIARSFAPQSPAWYAFFYK